MMLKMMEDVIMILMTMTMSHFMLIMLMMIMTTMMMKRRRKRKTREKNRIHFILVREFAFAFGGIDLVVKNKGCKIPYISRKKAPLHVLMNTRFVMLRGSRSYTPIDSLSNVGTICRHNNYKALCDPVSFSRYRGHVIRSIAVTCQIDSN